MHGVASVEKERPEVVEAERDASHDALCGVAGQEHLIWVVTDMEQQTQLGLGEILRLVNVHLVDDPL